MLYYWGQCESSTTRNGPCIGSELCRGEAEARANSMIRALVRMTRQHMEVLCQIKAHVHLNHYLEYLIYWYCHLP